MIVYPLGGEAHSPGSNKNIKNQNSRFRSSTAVHFVFLLQRGNECMRVRWGVEGRGWAGGDGEKESPADATPSTESDRGLNPTTPRYDLS